MPARDRSAKEKWKERVRKALKEADESFRGEYAEELDTLLGLSREEIDALTPDATDLDVYNRLIVVVREASRQNVSKAELRSQIRALGETAIKIAGKVSGLAKLFP